jgi:3-oxoacyl-[acyl-carrier-protein] synthase-3
MRLNENPIVGFEKDFLRWMLSDGAGAALIQNEPNKEGLSLKIDFLETRSYAGELETCMYMGALKNEDGSLQGWSAMEPEQWLTKSVFPFKQDIKLLGANILRLGARMLQDISQKNKINLEDVTYFCPHISSNYFKEKTYEEMYKFDLGIPWEKWFTNLSYVGNIGSASIFVMLEELLNTGKIKKGDKILCMVPESARFTYAWLQLTAV